MSTTKSTAVRIDPALHRALRRKAAETHCSVTSLVNEALRAQLAEDADDLAAIDSRKDEPVREFAAVVADLKRRGKL
jgi:hypothetical protein